MKLTISLGSAIAVVALSGCVSGAFKKSASLPEPPAMPRRQIAPTPLPEGSLSIELTNRDARATLFLPVGWTEPRATGPQLVVHFHTIAWFTIQEYVRRGSPVPLLNFALGEGSVTYAKPFLDPARFQEWLQLVERTLAERSASSTPIKRVDISSFSAGYGAVREIVKLETNRRVIQRIILCDSLYGGLVDANAAPDQRKVTSEHVEAWVPFAQAAARGEKTFLLTTSDVPTPRYASTREVSDALAAAVGAVFRDVPAKSVPATLDPEFPLLRRADVQGFHVWNYAGTNAQAHLTHVRHLADLWRALDAVKR
jgi:hypothetical protein